MLYLAIVAITVALAITLVRNTITAIVLFAGFVMTIASVGIYNGHVIQSAIVFICYMTVNVLLIVLFYQMGH